MKVKTCRLCLAVDVRILKLGNTGAKEFIMNVFAVNGCPQKLCSSHYICYECKALLEKSHNFIQRVLTAQRILVVMTKNTKITLSSIKEIDRQKTNISTCYETHVFKNIDIYGTDYCDREHKLGTIKKECDIDVQDLAIDEFETNVPIENQCNANGTCTEKTTKLVTVIDEIDYTLPKTKDNNVGDRTERRKKINYKVDVDDEEGKQCEIDEDYQLESAEESSDSDYDVYDDVGKRNKKPDPRVYPRVCDHCDYEVLVKRDHYKHYMCAHPTKRYPYQNKIKFVCQYCGQRYRKLHYLRDHEMTHGDRRDYQCSLCPNKFHNRERLSRHKLTTHATKFLECDYCHKKMKVKSDLRRHLRIHTGEKPFKCHICGAGFAHRGNIGIHIRTNHGYPLGTEKKKTEKSKRKRVLQSENKKKTIKNKIRNNRKKINSSSDDDDLNLMQLKKTKQAEESKSL